MRSVQNFLQVEYFNLWYLNCLQFGECVSNFLQKHLCNKGILAPYNFVRSVQNFLQGEYSSLSYLNCLQFGEKVYQTFFKITFDPKIA